MMFTLLTIVGAALGTAAACGGTQPGAMTPTNEGAVPSSESAPAPTATSNDTSSGTGTGAMEGSGPGMGAGGAATTTPPEGYAGATPR
jgi:hypothetical protein